VCGVGVDPRPGGLLTRLRTEARDQVHGDGVARRVRPVRRDKGRTPPITAQSHSPPPVKATNAASPATASLSRAGPPWSSGPRGAFATTDLRQQAKPRIVVGAARC